MEKQQTQVTEQNRQEFYQAFYPMSRRSVDQLVNLRQFGQRDCVLIDCAGKTYREQFPTSKTYIIETVTTAAQFQFTRDSFDKLVDNRTDDVIVWPGLDVVDPVLIFDQSPLIKYLTWPVFQRFIITAAEQYRADQIVINHRLIFIDDCRLQDRFYTLAKFQIPGYVVEQFVYDTENLRFNLKFKRIVHVD